PREREEVAVLDESADGAARVLAHHDGPGLLEQRRILAEQPGAVEPARATDTLGVVVVLVAALVIEQASHADAAIQEVEAGRERGFITRRRVPEEDRGVADLDLARRRVVLLERGATGVGDDAVAVLVREAEEAARPPAVERVPFALLQRRRRDDRRHAAER